MVRWNCDWNQVRFRDCVVEDSCFESLEIRMDIIDNLGTCELLAVLAQDLTDSHFAKLSEKGLIFRSRPAPGELENRAMLLLKKCLVPGKQKSKRVESAREVMHALSAEDRLMLQWISGVTRLHWAQRIEPISSIESHIAVFLAGLGSVEGGAKQRR